jgi:hypothetical protein
MYYVLKVFISAAIIVVVSETAKRSSFVGALLEALPLTSLLAIIWLWFEKTEMEKIAQLSSSVFWLVIPSLLLFVLFPLLIRKGLAFWPSFGIATLATVLTYWGMVKILNLLSIEL